MKTICQSIVLPMLLICTTLSGAALPDIRSVESDLLLPKLNEGAPVAGKRVKETLPAWRDSAVYHVIYLPTDWQPGRRYPVLVEFAGNGGYTNRYGDISLGTPEGSNFGYGISGGKGFIWICVPYLGNEGTNNVIKWWGDAPQYNPQPTIDYCKAAVQWVCREYGGDQENVILCGFSRGAIACNFVGLHDDEIAKLWKAFIAYSHYDGVIVGWPYPGADRQSARKRLNRLRGRPQFICGEGNNADGTRNYLRDSGAAGDFTYAGTGFRNHNDAWVLRPSETRVRLRSWLRRIVFDDSLEQ